MTYELSLPWPPTVNHYFENARRVSRKNGRRYVGRLISDRGLIFRAEVIQRVRRGHNIPPRLPGRLAIHIHANPPRKGRRDLDNLLKPLLDALMKAAVILDDSQFDDVRIVRGEVVKGGKVAVRIEQIGPEEAVSLLSVVTR